MAQPDWTKRPIKIATIVDWLMDDLAPFAIGQEWEHAAIEVLLREKRATKRYTMIVAAWRKRLLDEENLVLGNVWKSGYRILPADQRLTHACRRLGTVRRGAAHVGRIAGGCPREDLSAEQCRRADHVTRVAASITAALATAGRKIEPPAKSIKRITD